MLKVQEKLEQVEASNLVLTLPFELRQKSRLKEKLNDGTEVGVILPRGNLLRGGDCLRAEDGSVIRIEAANETVSTVHHDDAMMISRVSYHLGNRHVALEIGNGWVRYQHDHVLDDMVRGLGLEVRVESAPFEPEGGAYGGHSDSHSHGHAHSHQHGHSHDHES